MSEPMNKGNVSDSLLKSYQPATGTWRQINDVIIIEDDTDDSDNMDYADALNDIIYIDDSDEMVYSDDSVDDEDFTDMETCSSDIDEDDEKLKRYNAIVRCLRDYPPCDEVKKAHSSNFNDESLAVNNEIFSDYLKTKKLTPTNIAKVFHTLMTVEDLTCMSEYLPLAMKDISPVHCEKRTFYLNLPDLAKSAEEIIVPFMDEVVLIPKASLLASAPVKDAFETLLPHPHECQTDKSLLRHIATVEQVSKQRVTFYFNSSDFPGIHIIAQRYDIIIRPRRIPLRYQYRALELLDENPDIRNYLFPTGNPCSKAPVCANFNLINETIESNTEQLQAVRYIVEGVNPYAPYVVFGPPGTGKTTTIVEAILQLRLQRPRSRILVTAGSNSACDTIALRICEYFNSSPKLKLHIAHQEKQPTIFTLDVRADHQLIRIYSKSAFEKSGKSIDPLLLKHSNCKGGVYQHLGVDSIRQYGIIVATLCTVGMLVTAHLGKFHFFTHVFIDEAGASTEPETLVGIMGIKSDAECRVILSGDHKQLGPVVKSTRATQLGLEQSMMERLLQRECYALDANGNYDQTLQTRLRRNYRSHPEIVRLYNELYYNNELIAAAKAADVNMSANWYILPNAEFPIIFQAVHGITAKSKTSPSSFNRLEVQVLMWFVRRLLHEGIDGIPVQESDIGIITPYRAQCLHIKQELQKHKFKSVEVGSVETFQGREKHIVIVSLVRSFSGMGFVRNPRRLNVLLSRAKSMLILIGNPLTLKRNKDFKYLIQECLRQGTYMCKRRPNKILRVLSKQDGKKFKTKAEVKTINVGSIMKPADNLSKRQQTTAVASIVKQTKSQFNTKVSSASTEKILITIREQAQIIRSFEDNILNHAHNVCSSQLKKLETLAEHTHILRSLEESISYKFDSKLNQLHEISKIDQLKILEIFAEHKQTIENIIVDANPTTINSNLTKLLVYITENTSIVDALQKYILSQKSSSQIQCTNSAKSD